MGHDDWREVLDRLEALERRMGSEPDRRDSRGEGRQRDERDCDRRDRRDRHDRSGRRNDGDFDEKRIIDTIVHLVSEQVGRMFEDQQARAPHREDGGDEKRIVDLIVGLVSEHVEEIVETALDRRLGRPAPAGAGDERLPGPTAPEDPERR